MHNELYHHGILGQKWGVRRYQNPDGTLTSAGIKRYYDQENYGNVTIYHVKGKRKTKAAEKFNQQNKKAYDEYGQDIYKKMQSDPKIKKSIDNYYKETAKKDKFFESKSYDDKDVRNLYKHQAQTKWANEWLGTKGATTYGNARKRLRNELDALAKQDSRYDQIFHQIENIVTVSNDVNSVSTSQRKYGQEVVKDLLSGIDFEYAEIEGRYRKDKYE